MCVETTDQWHSFESKESFPPCGLRPPDPACQPAVEARAESPSINSLARGHPSQFFVTPGPLESLFGGDIMLCHCSMPNMRQTRLLILFRTLASPTHAHHEDLNEGRGGRA